ncbi:MAG: hypothetical protein O7A63_11300 [Acidobacteria bacterium]|nr:hypothetical protein [Acidobacteriota bacterium]
MMLALPTAPREERRERRKREGRVLILRPTVAGVAIVQGVVIKGEGVRAVVSQDGGTAYVLTHRPGRSVASGVGVRIHAIDLPSGKVTGSTALASPPFGMALASDGRRLFLSRPGRIDTLTTDPLVISWHYRSPGTNLGLKFNRHDGALYVTRDRGIIQFDPRVIAQRSVEERRAMSDDASLKIPLSIRPHELTFSGDGRIGAAFGRQGRMIFFDPQGANELGSHDLSERGTPLEMLRVVHFNATGPLLVAAFPGPSLIRLPVPPPASLIVHRGEEGEQTAQVSPHGVPHPLIPPTGDTPAIPTGGRPVASAADVDGRPTVALEEASHEEATAPEPASVPPIRSVAKENPAPPPETLPARSPLPPEAKSDEKQEEAPTPGRNTPEALILQGTIAGEAGLVGAIVIYGPGSIIREAARVRPGKDGRWKAALTEPGRYRVVPIGAGAGALQTHPHFHTVEVKGAGGVKGIDFEIRKSP